MSSPVAIRNEAYIAERIEYDPFGGCWLWSRSASSNGYGKARLGGKYEPQIGAHTLSWRVFCGDIPDGLQVLHRCDIKTCVNPDHLFLGSQLDNMRDMHAKDRYPVRKGGASSCAKLSDIDALEIRLRRGESATDLALEFEVSAGTIRRVWSRFTFKHLPEERTH